MAKPVMPSMVFDHRLWADGSCFSEVTPGSYAHRNSRDMLEGDVAAVKTVLLDYLAASVPELPATGSRHGGP